MWDGELDVNAKGRASEGFIKLLGPSVQAQLVGKIGQSFSTICIIISKEASESAFVFSPSTTSLQSSCEAPVLHAFVYVQTAWLRLDGGFTWRRDHNHLRAVKKGLRERSGRH